MDFVKLLDIWKIRGNLMKSVPKFMQGVYRDAMRHALDAIIIGEARADVVVQSCFSSSHGCSSSAPTVWKVLKARVKSLQWRSLGRIGRDEWNQFSGCSPRTGCPRGPCGEEDSQSLPYDPIGRSFCKQTGQVWRQGMRGL